jgi:hypothetical protein
MFFRVTFSCLLAIIIASSGLNQDALAQGLLKKAKQKAEQAAGKVVGAAADAAADKAAERAADAAVKKVDDAFGESDGAAGGGQGTGVGAAGGGAAGAAGVLNALGGMIGAAAGGGGTVETVDFRELRDLLPERLGRLARTDARGERSNAFGISTSNAHGTYAAGDGDASIEIQISDLGSMRSFALFGYAWVLSEMDVENERGHERTVKFKGYPGYETFEREGGWSSAQLQVIVGERFLVSVEGSGVPLDEVHAAMERIDLAHLEGMKDFGVTAAAEVMEFQVLREMLPAGLPGMERTNATGQKSNAMGITSSYAEGTYGGGGGSITLKITDLGSMQGLAAFGFGWLNATIETENDRGYERTGTYKGFRSHEKFERDGDWSSAQMDLLVHQRFMISAQGSGVSMDQIRGALDRIDVSRLPAPDDGK